MKKTFTQFRALACLFLFAFSLGLSAQPMQLKIDGPSTIAGRYDLLSAGFGPKAGAEILDKPTKQGNMPDSLACTSLTTDLTGTIAFVDRGTCNFIVKTRLAQSKGAIAVIICNNTAAIVAPGLPAGEANNVTIQTFMMDKPNCDKIKVEMRKGTVNASLVFPPCAPTVDTTIKNAIWGAKAGEGDFAGGIGTWTIETPAGKGWEWNLWGDVGKGAFAGRNFISSNTGCNGAMVFDSDFLDTKGAAATAGQGTCPAPCTSSFTSPNIDLSSVTGLKGLSVQFTQAYRQFQSEFMLLASYDNGVKWDTIEINGEAPVNSAVFLNNRVKVGLCNADLSKKQVKLRFSMVGNYYFWAIDDVFLINDDAADIQTNNFFATPYTYKTPISQAYNFPFLADVSNNGPLGSTNTILTATIDKVTGTATAPIFTNLQTETNNYNVLNACQTVENIPFTNRAKQPATEGVYRTKYAISGSSKNDNTSNDTREATFRMTQNSYSTSLNEVENGAAFLENFSTITNPAFIGKNNITAGQYYFFPKGKGFKASRFYFGVNDNKTATGLFESILTCEVHKVKTGGTDAILDAAELTKVAVGFDPALPDNEDLFVDSSTVNRRRLYFGLKGLDGKPFNLEDNTGYVFLIKTSYIKGPAYSTTSTFHLFPFLAFNQDRFPNFNGGAAEFANNDVVKGERNYGALLNNIDALTGNSTVRIYNEVIIEPLTDIEEPLAETAFTVYPNPASTELFVDVDLVNIAKQVKVELTDITGRVLVTQTLDNIKSETITLPVSKIPSGVYLTKISTPEGSATKKVIIAN